MSTIDELIENVFKPMYPWRVTIIEEARAELAALRAERDALLIRVAELTRILELYAPDHQVLDERVNR